MKKSTTIEKNDKRVLKFIESYKKANEKEIKVTSALPYGYAMRSYHRLKNMADHTGRVRNKVKDFLSENEVSDESIRLLKANNII